MSDIKWVKRELGERDMWKRLSIQLKRDNTVLYDEESRKVYATMAIIVWYGIQADAPH